MMNKYNILGIMPVEKSFNGKNIPCWNIFLETNNKIYLVELFSEEGRCPSGWTTASWGHNDFSEYTCALPKVLIKPKKNISIMYTDDINCFNEVFECNYNGGDSWYPRGYIKINRDLFK